MRSLRQGAANQTTEQISYLTFSRVQIRAPLRLPQCHTQAQVWRADGTAPNAYQPAYPGAERTEYGTKSIGDLHSFVSVHIQVLTSLQSLLLSHSLLLLPLKALKFLSYALSIFSYCRRPLSLHLRSLEPHATR